MEILLALGSAIAYGGSDFLGGLISRTRAILPVLLVGQIVAFAVLVPVLPFLAGAASPEAVAWGALAGLAGIGGTAALYRGLAVGRMGVVAPISGVLSAGIPVVAGLALGERPGALAVVGIVVGIVAITAVSRTPDDPAAQAVLRVAQREVGMGRWWPGVPEAIAAGTGFGLFFVLLERAPTDSGIWPLVGTRAVSVLVLLAIAIFIRPRLGELSGAGTRLLGLGALNGSADLLFLLATREGLLSLVAVITSLYPAFTVLLARSVLRERIAASQGVGLALAAASVVLIAVG